jgi:hypothetical protein
MTTKGLRLYGKSDLRLEEFPLPKLCEDEILARVVTDSMLARDGCLYFFAGPTAPAFSAEMRESLSLLSNGRINPAAMIAHIGGLESSASTTLNLSQIPGVFY